jgi:hypothetical protein
MRAQWNRDTRNAAISHIFSVSSADSGARGSRSIHPTFSPAACTIFTTVSNPGWALESLSVRLSVVGVMPASHAIAECLLSDSFTASRSLGQTTHAGIDGKDFNFEHHFDESGNVTSSKTPARRGETTYDHDARSFMTAEHPDGTFEEIHYDGARVDWTRDRQNREQHFAYDDSGRLYEVTNAARVVLNDTATMIPKNRH